MIGFMLRTKRSSAAHTAPIDLEGRYQLHRGIHVLRVSGDDYEIGYQHGALLKHAIDRGPLPQLATYLEKVLAKELGPRLGVIAARVLQNTVGGAIASRMPEHVVRALAGLIDGAGLSRESIRRAVTMPDTFLWMFKQGRALFKPIAPRLGVPVLGCTSAIAWGDATSDGAVLHGRNFDYPGVGTWDREQALVFHRPQEGQPYVSCASPGILFGGITAMNASGITLVVHQHMACDLIRMDGVAIGVAGDQVMRHAKTLDDAVRILEQHPPAGCWTYVMTSAHEERVLCYEVTPELSDAMWIEGGTFGYSNIYLSKKLADHERLAYPAHWRNVAERYHHANRLLEEKRGSIDADHIARVLGFTGGPECRFHSAISTLMTITSVVFRPLDRSLWLALGPAPTSNRAYAAFSLDREGPLDTPDLSGGMIEDADAAAAFDAYREAYEAYFIREDAEAARPHLARAVELQPEQSVYRFVAGLMALSVGANREAEELLQSAIDVGHPEPARMASYRLWLSRVRALKGRRARRFGIDMMYADAA
jgi:hypothetical protein